MHEGIASYSLGLAGQPSAAEDAIVFRDLEVARLTGGRLHLCHLSTAGSVEEEGCAGMGASATAEAETGRRREVAPVAGYPRGPFP